jgi:aspartate racemase
MDLLDQRITSLTPAKRRLLELRLRERKGGTPPTSIPRRKQQDPAPASFGQQWLWLVDQIDPGNCLFSTQRAYRLTGPLDVAALHASLHRVVARHDVLRTTFSREDEGPPRQVVHPVGPVPLPLMDLSGFPEQERETLARQIAEAAYESFDLQQGPVWKARLLRLGPDDHVLLLMVHHIAFDGWSTGVFLRDLTLGYEEACSRTASGSPIAIDRDREAADRGDLPIQYADFAAWQRQWLTEDRLAPQVEYWKSHLAGLPTLNLPLDKARPDTQSHRGRRLVHLLPRELTERLKDLGRQHRATPFMVLLAGFNVLLHRYSGDEDVVVGSQIAARNHVETEGLIGLFTNTLVLRTDLSGDPTFVELLRRTREVCLGAFANQDLSYEEIVRRLNPARELTRTPLFQVAFQLRSFPNLSARVAGLAMEAFEYDCSIAKLDLNLLMTERPQGFEAVFEYCTDLFEETTVQQMADHLEVLLAAAVADPLSRISELPLLEDAERRKVLIDFNATATDYPRDCCVHELIQLQAQRSPDAVAATCDSDQLSYNELNCRANRLARELRLRGVGPDVPVGLFCERSLDLAVGLLGILKAGGAVLPLDSRCPGERLTAILREAQTPVLLTQPHLVDHLPREALSCELLAMGQSPCRLTAHGPGSIAGHAAGIERHSPDDPPCAIAPHHLAYVIYTSGTTGAPKGVAITHRSLVNHGLAAVRLYGLQAHDRVLQFSAIDFDIAVEEILPTWMCGACVVFRTDRTPLSGAGFSRWCNQEQITVLDLPTSFWHTWTDELVEMKVGAPESLRVLIVGGEAASSEAYKSWLGVGGAGARWFNTYGPTETTVIATAYEPQHNVSPGEVPAKLPIGRPIANVRAYILDQHHRPVPIGVPGELYIAGAGVARGYLNRPDLTAERFVPDPFCAEGPETARMYRTSDRCRWLADGSIEFLGRLDDQLKIRGFRIEPGEIEAVLGRHPAVHQCVVKPCGEGNDRRLAAYLTTDGHARPTKGDLRGYLMERLPEYMVPAAFMVVDRMPLTHNGKIDRRALPAPDLEGQLTDESHCPPRSPTERHLVELWEDLLGVRPIGVRDDFFALGGHSLMAVRLVARIEQSLGVVVPIAALLSSPTIESLARRIDHEGCGGNAGVVVPLQPNGTAPPLFLVAGVGGHVFVFGGLAKWLGEDQPVYGLQGIGLDGQEAPVSRMEEIAARYIKEITAVQPEGPYYVAGWSLGGVIAYEIAVQLAAQGRKLGALIVIDTIAPWEHSRAQRIRVHLEAFRRRSVPEKAEYIAQRIWHQIQTAKRRLGFYPPVVGFDGRTAALVRKSGMAQGEARRHYRPQPFDGDLVVLRAEHHPEARDPRINDPHLGWDTLIRGRIHVRQVPGSHMGILTDNGQRLAETLRPSLGASSRLAELAAGRAVSR